MAYNEYQKLKKIDTSDYDPRLSYQEDGINVRTETEHLDSGGV